MYSGACNKSGFDRIDTLAKSGEDFLFIISFDKQNILSYPLDSLPESISFEIDGLEYGREISDRQIQDIKFNPSPISYEEYCSKFEKIIEEIKRGNTYLLNLTQPTKIDTNLTLKDIYSLSKAKYKLYIKEQFVCFSPESFIEIKNNTIYTYPMKGTIDADIEDAKDKILSNPKEMAEHTMVVDLMRNDLNMVGFDTKVDDFRYIDKIQAGNKELLQVSSKISAKLDNNWRDRVGTILNTLTPAGSISGTPKCKTLEIINRVEGYSRGFFSGIFGVCIGDKLKSAVMIRYIEKQKDGFVYKSGGGITLDSVAIDEYKEMIAKVYLPSTKA